MVQDITVFNKLLTFFINKLFKQKTYQLNHRYLIKVVELMTPRLRKPKHKSKFIWYDGEMLPIILIDTMEGKTE